MNSSPICVGESPIAKPKAGITTNMPTGAKSFAQCPIEKGIRNSVFIGAQFTKKYKQKTRRISLPGFLLIKVKQI